MVRYPDSCRYNPVLYLAVLKASHKVSILVMTLCKTVLTIPLEVLVQTQLRSGNEGKLEERMLALGMFGLISIRCSPPAVLGYAGDPWASCQVLTGFGQKETSTVEQEEG